MSGSRDRFSGAAQSVRELFGHGAATIGQDWAAVVERQQCPFVAKKCFKVRKSQPEVAIGTCTVTHKGRPVVICPKRFTERQQIFTDCLQLIRHEPGNELHVVSEVAIPGGLVDYFLVSAREREVRDFVGIEIQTMDTTGSLWPARQAFLRSAGLAVVDVSAKPYGMNWKMTAKTILVQLHHKVRTFESVKRHLVLAIQDVLLDYIEAEFSTAHLAKAHSADPLQIHAYGLVKSNSGELTMRLERQLSTDAAGVATALGLKGEARVELSAIGKALEAKISDATLLRLGGT